MNERLTELYRSCRSKEGLASQDEYKSADVLLGTEVAKFAELIVRECVEQIQICSDQIKNDDGYAPDNFWPIMQSIVDAVAEDVREHFGVE